VEPLFGRRAYEEAEAFWSGHADDEGLPSAREIIAARVEEARILRELLSRAAAGVRERNGQQVRLPQGGLYVQGTVESTDEPLRDGFRVVLSSSSSKEFVLRLPAKRGWEVLDHRSVELFVTEGVDDDVVAEDLRLPLALFRFHEGDYEGAHELRRAGDSDAATLVERELSRRVDAELDSGKAVESQRRKLAVAEFRAVMDKATDVDDPELLAGRIQRLILEYGGAGDVLTKAEVSELRERRRELLTVAPPSTLEEFRAVYAPTEVGFPTFDRARLRYAFQASEVGAWSSGRWYFDGTGWCGPVEVDLDGLVEHRAPTLSLVDPLLVDLGPLDVTLRLFQPADSPPELFLVSVVGIHVAVAGPAEGHGGRVLADNTDALDVASRAATGEGEEFAGLAKDSEHTLRLLLLRTSGKVDVWVDGTRVTSVIRNPPRDRPVTSELSFRALEPLCVREVVIEGKRR